MIRQDIRSASPYLPLVWVHGLDTDWDRECQDKIPVAEKDFMFSALTEEFGIIFTVALLLICLNNLILMMNIASRCKTLFYRLVAVGLGVTYGFQVFLTVGGAIKNDSDDGSNPSVCQLWRQFHHQLIGDVCTD